MPNYKEGNFYPRHPEKYMGDVNTIKFKSSWEEHAFNFLDMNPNVLHWSYEGVQIPYLKPNPTAPNGFVPAVYIPDLLVVYKDKTGKIHKEMIEIKPKKQARVSKAKKAETRVMENYVYMVNQAKWEQAKKWCEKYGIAFKLLTEDHLFR
jgi:hypothetical protein